MGRIRTIQRMKARATSNNPANPNKNVCALKVAQALYVADETRYLHTWEDLKRAIGKLWSFRSVKSAVKLKDGGTVGSIRKALKAHAEASGECAGYVVMVEGHVLLLDMEGNTVVDTAPRQRDRRAVKEVYAVYAPTSNRSKFAKLRMKVCV
jgi:hypothetical protein